jgi:hypothetical protein
MYIFFFLLCLLAGRNLALKKSAEPSERAEDAVDGNLTTCYYATLDSTTGVYLWKLSLGTSAVVWRMRIFTDNMSK